MPGTSGYLGAAGLLTCLACGVQERARLEAWRNSVREKYEKSSYNTDIPAALPRQLTVSQRVTARHPVTRQLHDGDVLTIAPDCYRQAHRCSSNPQPQK